MDFRKLPRNFPLVFAHFEKSHSKHLQPIGILFLAPTCYDAIHTRLNVYQVFNSVSFRFRLWQLFYRCNLIICRFFIIMIFLFMVFIIAGSLIGFWKNHLCNWNHHSYAYMQQCHWTCHHNDLCIYRYGIACDIDASRRALTTIMLFTFSQSMLNCTY